MSRWPSSGSERVHGPVCGGAYDGVGFGSIVEGERLEWVRKGGVDVDLTISAYRGRQGTCRGLKNVECNGKVDVGGRRGT